MKKRLIALILGAVMASSLFACTSTPKEENVESSVPQESAEAPVQEEVEEAAPSEEPTAETPEEAVAEPVVENVDPKADEKNLSFLKTYFAIDSVPDDMNLDDFNAALKKIAGDEVVGVTGEMNSLEVIKAANNAADFEELALSYPKEKADERLKVYGIEGVDEAYAAFFASALDTGLATEVIAKKAAASEALTGSDVAALLMAVADAKGLGRNFLGYSNDFDIYAKLQNTWNSFSMFSDEQLMNLGNASVENKITTGFNFKQSNFDARFLPELSLQYGHSDIKHAHQLMGLLNSENIVAKVQLEPKVSAYEYLLEWGDPPTEPTPTYEVKKVKDDLYIAYAIEYDMMLEFATEEERLAFDEVIKTYAKKNEGNEDAIGLIYGAWWQPLYSSTVEIPGDDYHLIYDCVVTNGEYSIHPFCLAENLDQVKADLEKLDSSLKVEPVARYCNTAFLNYMTGDDYQ